MSTARVKAKRGLGAKATNYKAVEVAVSADVIRKAMPRDSSHCMIADSLKLAFPKCSPGVDLATMRYSDRASGVRYTFLTPPSVQDALIKFDQGESVEPFTFKLQRPILVQQVRRSAKKASVGGEVPDDKSTDMEAAARPSQRRQGIARAGGTNVPVILGGPSMPNSVLANGKGRIRAFGLRQLRP